MEIHRDWIDGKFWVITTRVHGMILRKFGMCPSNEEEKGYMSRVWYASRNIDDCDERMRYFTCSWGCQWSHDKSRWSSEMGASVLEALVSLVFSLQEGDEWTMAWNQVHFCQGGEC